MWFHDENLEEEDRGIRHLPIMPMLRRIVPLFRPYRGTLAIAALMLIVVTAAELIGPFLVRDVLDMLTGATEGGESTGVLGGIVNRAVLYALLYVVGMTTAYFQVILLVRMGLKIVTGLRQKVFAHLLDLSLAYFDKNPPGRLMARVESDVERLLMLFSEIALVLLRSVLLLVGTFGAMVFVNARVTGAILMLMVPIVVGTYFFLQYIRKRYRLIRKLYARIPAFLTEFVQNIPLLQLYGYTEKALFDLKRVNQEKFSIETRVMYAEYVFWGAFFGAEIAAVMVIIYVGVPQVLAATMTVGTLVLFIDYTRRLFWPLLMFSEQLNGVQQAFASADRVFGILDTPSRTPDAPDASKDVPEDWREIAFENVSFAYDGGARALDEVDLRIRRGEKIAVVGLSGGGKTTLTNLLLRYYEPSQGAVTLDGVDIRRYQQRVWRGKIGLVLQDIHLFPGTLGDNLRVLRDDVSDEALDRAIRIAQAEEMVRRLPAGYETELSEGGGNLSMGERQMLCFARAIVEDPDLLILDEATSSVDPLTERRLQESLDHLMEGRTSLIVAHRLTTITKADRILVMHHGKLAEEGTHTELYERGGIYRDLFDLQFATQKSSLDPDGAAPAPAGA